MHNFQDTIFIYEHLYRPIFHICISVSLARFQSSVSVAFHIETSHLICRAKQMTGSYIEG